MFKKMSLFLSAILILTANMLSIRLSLGGSLNDVEKIQMNQITNDIGLNCGTVDCSSRSSKS